MFRTLVEMVERAKILSFDIFDTAILRSVGEPVDVFTLVEHQYLHLAGSSTTSFDFATERQRAESRMREIVWLRERRGEVLLHEIYEELKTPEDWNKGRLLELELETERVVCSRNPWIFELYQEACRLGRPVIFISDMYLPAPFIARLLDDAGYDSRLALFVSSKEAGRSKGLGTLYREVRAQLGAGPGDILHIGDNVYSDVVMAMRNGVAACLYERCRSLAKRRPWHHPGDEPAAMIYRGLIYNHLFSWRGNDPHDPWYRLGYEVFGLAWTTHGQNVDDYFSMVTQVSPLSRLKPLLAQRTDRRTILLMEGASAFTDDLGRLKAHFTWLRPSIACAQAPLVRDYFTLTKAEWKMLSSLRTT